MKNTNFKKVTATMMAGYIALALCALPIIPVYASSLDDVINQQSQTTQSTTGTIQGTTDGTTSATQGTTGTTTGTTTGSTGTTQEAGTGGVTPGTANTPSIASDLTGTSGVSATGSSVSPQNKSYIQSIESATDLSETSEMAAKVNEKQKQIASIVVQIISYFVVVCLVVRVVLDLCYIAIPFSRGILAHGQTGNPASAGMQQPGIGGMGMGGMGMGGYGGGYGGYGSRYGMGGMGGMGMGMGGMNPQQQQQQQAFQVHWVSNAALNAVAAESMVGPDGKTPNGLKLYAKDMIVVLILTPVLLVLAITGVLTQLGFVLGGALVNGISSISKSF